MTGRAFLIVIYIAVNLASFLGEEKVELLEHNLIDLDKAIEASALGEETDSNDISDEGEKDPDNSEDTDDKDPVRLVFKIRGKEMYYTGKNVYNRSVTVSDAEKLIRSEASDDLTVILEDGYADSKIYREADGIMEKLKTELGFKYEEVETAE